MYATFISRNLFYSAHNPKKVDGEMRRALYIFTALAALTGCGIWFYTQWYIPNTSQQFYEYGVISPDRPVWVQLSVILILLAVGLGFAFESFSANIHRVYDGEVVDKQFIPEHENPGYTYPMMIGKVMIMQRMPATHVPDEYRIKLRRTRDGRVREGWLSVNKTAYNTPRGGYVDLRRKK